MFKLWPLLLLFFSTSAHAVDWIFRNTFESYLYYNYANPLDNDVNPGNHVFALPSGTGVVDLRDDFSLLTRDTKWVVRPRWTLTNTKIEMKDPTDSSSTTRGKMDLTAGYLDWDLSKTWKAVLGLQVYQWGPGEFMNPSNVFFHFSSDARSFSFVQKGLVMARLNWTPSERWNFVFMSEPVSNNEPSFQAEKPFEPKSTLKVEYRGASNSFLGAVAGTEAPETLFFGEYFDWYVTDSFSLYADIRHTSSNNVYDPLDDGMGNIQLVQQDPAFGQMTTIADWGLRWEGAVDIRLEWFYNGMGWNDDALKAAISGITYPNPYLVENLKRFAHSGLELPGQNYLYASIRIPDLGKRRDANLYMRNILSMQDQSGVVQLSGDKALSDSWSGYLELIDSYGKDNTEFRLLYGLQANIGIRWAH